MNTCWTFGYLILKKKICQFLKFSPYLKRCITLIYFKFKATSIYFKKSCVDESKKYITVMDENVFPSQLINTVYCLLCVFFVTFIGKVPSWFTFRVIYVVTIRK